MTNTQRAALHLGFDFLAKALNDAGLDKQAVFKVKKISVPWTKNGVKEDLYKPILEAVSKKCSTEDMDTIEPGEVWDILMEKLGASLGLEYIPFPSSEPPLMGVKNG